MLALIAAAGWEAPAGRRRFAGRARRLEPAPGYAFRRRRPQRCVDDGPGRRGNRTRDTPTRDRRRSRLGMERGSGMAPTRARPNRFGQDARRRAQASRRRLRARRREPADRRLVSARRSLQRHEEVPDQFTSRTVAGWTAVVTVTLLLGGVQLLALGMIGQYIARIFEETKGRPLSSTRPSSLRCRLPIPRLQLRPLPELQLEQRKPLREDRVLVGEPRDHRRVVQQHGEDEEDRRPRTGPPAGSCARRPSRRSCSGRRARPTAPSARGP